MSRGFVPCNHHLQRNFTEISRVGEEVTARLWLEVKDKNDEFSECVVRSEIVNLCCSHPPPPTHSGTRFPFLSWLKGLARSTKATGINDACSVIRSVVILTSRMIKFGGRSRGVIQNPATHDSKSITAHNSIELNIQVFTGSAAQDFAGVAKAA